MRRPLHPHAPRIPERANPGALFIRIVTHDDLVISQHKLGCAQVAPSGDWISRLADEDQEVAFQWLRNNPMGVVYIYIYDGDTGDCLKTIIMAGYDVRQQDKRRRAAS